MITWSRLAGLKFCPTLPGSQQCYKLFIIYILRLHVIRFVPARRDPTFVRPGSRFAWTKFSHVITSVHPGGIKKLIKKYLQKYISIDRRYFYCAFTTHVTSICDKKSLQLSLQNFIILQKQPPEVFCKKGVLKIFSIFTRKHLCRSLFAGLQVCNFIKKRFQR